MIRFFEQDGRDLWAGTGREGGNQSCARVALCAFDFSDNGFVRVAVAWETAERGHEFANFVAVLCRGNGFGERPHGGRPADVTQRCGSSAPDPGIGGFQAADDGRASRGVAAGGETRNHPNLFFARQGRQFARKGFRSSLRPQRAHGRNRHGFQQGIAAVQRLQNALLAAVRVQPRERIERTASDIGGLRRCDQCFVNSGGGFALAGLGELRGAAE